MLRNRIILIRQLTSNGPRMRISLSRSSSFLSSRPYLKAPFSSSAERVRTPPAMVEGNGKGSDVATRPGQDQRDAPHAQSRDHEVQRAR